MGEAICKVLTALPLDQMGSRLTDFVLPVAQELHQLSQNPPAPAAQGEEGEVDESQEVWLKQCGDLIAQLAVFVKHGNPPNVRRQVTGGARNPMMTMLEQLWPTLDSMLEKHGRSRPIARTMSRLIVNAVEQLGSSFLPLLPTVLNRIVPLYQETHGPNYLWICKRCFEVYNADTNVGAQMMALMEAVSQTTFAMLEKCSVDEFPDSMYIS
jgi:hypothetical protein